MNSRVRKRVHFLLLISMLILAGLYYQVEHKLATQSVLVSLNSRIDIVKRYLSLLLISEKSLRNSAEMAFQRFSDPSLFHFDHNALSYHPQWHIWSASQSSVPEHSS